MAGQFGWGEITPDLGTIDEYVAFSHSITYSDEILGQLKVILTPNQTQPDTIYIAGNNITGYYSDVFDINIRYKNNKGKFVDVNNFRKIDLEELHEVISYFPVTVENREYTYEAVAYDFQDNVVASQTYTKVVNNNWDINRKLLIQYVKNTVVADSELFNNWINSINGAVVRWRNSTNTFIDWAHVLEE